MTKVTVAGGGIVGVSCAMTLQARGYQVQLIDRQAPGHGTSFGNAGLISPGSVLVLNNPALWRSLPGLLRGKGNALRIDYGYLLRNLPWCLRFLSHATVRSSQKTGIAMRDLMVDSANRHEEWVKQAKAGALRKGRSGWLKCFRSSESYDRFRYEMDFMTRFGGAFHPLGAEEIANYEPGLPSIYRHAVFVEEAYPVSDPLALTTAYADHFKKLGGEVIEAEIINIERSQNGWSVSIEQKESGTSKSAEVESDQLVIAAGPWSDVLLRMINIKAPLRWERGYHVHLPVEKKQPPIKRAILDVEGGFVMAPMRQGVRITSGVELNHRDAPPNYKQITEATRLARSITGLGSPIETKPWMGCRPVLPDSLPMIGPVKQHSGLWVNFGHHHLGLTLGPGSAALLADLMDGKPRPDAEDFSPKRFI